MANWPGMATAVFTALNAVLLRPLPYQQADRLAWIFGSNPKIGYPRLPVNWSAASKLISATSPLLLSSH
jgi:hypothetical protein